MRQVQRQIRVILGALVLLALGLVLIVGQATGNSVAARQTAPDQAGAVVSQAGPQTQSSDVAVKGQPPAAPAAPRVVLYDQYNNAAAGNITSQDFETANDPFDNQAADDFTVPATQTWSIDGVDVDGVYQGSGPAASFNVYFYANSGTLPGAPIVTRTLQTYTGAAGDAVITVSPPVVLTPGTYWVSVQARQDFTPAGQWFWVNRTVQTMSQSAWRNPGGGFGTACANWGAKLTCIPTQVGPDQVFRLNGTIGGGGTATPTATAGASTPTATAGASTPTATPCAVNYTFITSTTTLITGTTDIGNACDDCSTTINLPFPVRFYGVNYSSANIISNGSLQFASANTAFTNACMPVAASNQLISPHWDDLRTDANTGCAGYPGGACGVFTSTTGAVGSRIFAIEWRAVYFAATGTPVNFEILFYENSPVNRIDFVYGTGSNSTSATVGLQRDTGSLFAQYLCNTAGVNPGLQIIWTQPCGTPLPTNTPGTPTVTRTPTIVLTPTRTNTPGTTTPTPCAGGTIVVQGAIDASDPVQTGGRLFRDGIADTCAVPGTCGAPIAGSYRYDLYTYTNSSASSVCINVNVNTACAGTNFIYSGAYLGSFNPANICQNWVADLGSSPQPTGDYSFTVPAGATFVINVHEVTANAGCAAYTLTITGLPAGGCPGSPTPAPASPTRTVTQQAASPTRTVTPPVGITASATATTPPITPTNPPVATATSTPCPIQFTDVDQNNPFYSFIRCLACRQIVSGYSDGTFRWGNNVTRGQLSKIISGAAGQSNNIPSSQQTFEDVPNSNAFWLFIERLAGVGAISGYNCGGPGEPCGSGNRPYFRWGNSATRGQISKITAVTAGWNGPIPTTQQSFEDVPMTNPFWLWIEELASRQVISGYNCGGPGEPCGPGNRPYFRWGNNATRGQMSKIAAESFFPGCATPARPAANDR